MNDEKNLENLNEETTEPKENSSLPVEEVSDNNKTEEVFIEIQDDEPTAEEIPTADDSEYEEIVFDEPSTEIPSDESNSQYTYHGVNPEPTNYYSGQKHYIPNEYTNPSQPRHDEDFFKPEPSSQNNNKKPKNSKKGFKIFVAIALAITVFVVGVGFGRLSNDFGNNQTISSESPTEHNGEDIDVNSGNAVERDDIKPDENGRYTPDQVAQLVSDSVVNIQVYSTTDSSSGATASGVILNNDGYIITNDHIYSEVSGAKFVITMNNGMSYKASYVAGDQRSDIAVLKFDEMPKNLQAATFADSSTVRSGDEVIAIGSPYGFSGTVTKGIISYPSRRITTSTKDSQGNTVASYSMRVIQTDAALNSGNSGGALVNMYGQVVGINSSKIASTGYEGLCFAIPANDAIKYAKSLVKHGAVVNRARLGITYVTITSAAALLNDLPAGLLIQEIDPESELSKKGLTIGDNGDIITEMNGKKITSSDIALDIIDDSSAGDEVEIKVYSRSTKRETTYKVKLLEDTSNTSYVNEPVQPSTTTASGFDGNGDGDAFDYFEYFESPFDFGQ